MYSLTFRVRVTTPPQYGSMDEMERRTQQARRCYRWRGESSPARVASNQQQHAQETKEEIKDEIKSVETLLASGSVKTNETRLEEVVQEIKDMIDSKMDLLRDEVNNGKRLLVTLEPSKQSLQVFGLLCEYVRCS